MIADQNIRRSYYDLNFPNNPPDHWPDSPEQAIEQIIKIIVADNRVPIFRIPEYDYLVYEEIGLSNRYDPLKRDYPVNKELLRNMGRISEDEARKLILDKVWEFLEQTYTADIKKRFSSTVIKMINFSGTYLDQAVQEVLKRIDPEGNIALMVDGNASKTRVNLSLRNLDTYRIFEYILGQVDYTITLEIQEMEQTTLYLEKVERSD